MPKYLKVKDLLERLKSVDPDTPITVDTDSDGYYCIECIDSYVMVDGDVALNIVTTRA